MPTYPELKVEDTGQTALLATVYITHWHSGRRFLIGQDSANGAPPFVVQVPMRCKTVYDAFEFLKPKVVRDAEARGLDVKRQGDWFFIPSKSPTGPSYPLRRYIPTGHGLFTAGQMVQDDILYSMTPYDDGRPPQDRHRVIDLDGIAHKVVYRANFQHYVYGLVIAPDHEPLALQTWHIAVQRNFHPWGRVTGGNRTD